VLRPGRAVDPAGPPQRAGKPRWLFIHGREKQADDIVTDIEQQVRSGVSELPDPEEEITVRQRHAIGFITIAKTLLGRYPRRSALSFSLFIGQAFLYNAIFFTYAIALTTFYKVAAASVGLYLLPFAAAGPGRRRHNRHLATAHHPAAARSPPRSYRPR
jgi:hypothetical protein